MPDTPLPWPNAGSNPFVVQALSDFQSDTHVAPLSDGRFVVTFLDLTGGDRIGFRIYDADGSPAGSSQFPPELAGRSGGVLNLTAHDVAARDDGGFTIVLSEIGNMVSTNLTDSIAYNFDATGAFVDRDDIANLVRDENHSVEVDGFADGFVAVSDHATQGIRFVAVNGPAINDVVELLPIGSDENHLDADVAYLGNGRAVVAYVQETPGLVRIHWDVVSTNTGQVLLSDIAPNLSGPEGPPSVAATEGGGFVIAYHNESTTAFPSVRFIPLTFYDDQGQMIVTRVVPAPIDAVLPRVASAGDDVVVAWRQTDSGDVFLQRYSLATTQAVGDVVTVATGVPDATMSDIEVTGDGRFLIGLTLDTASANANAGFALYDPRGGSVASSGGQITAPASGGTVVASPSTESGQIERLFGSDGDDTFVLGVGSGGIVGVDGGAGIDTLDFSAIAAGPGLSLTGPAAPFDGFNVVGSFGSMVTTVAEFVEGTDVENFVGSSGRDAILATTAADNVIDLAGGADLYAFSADNTAGGDDRISGGTGEDTLDLSDAAGDTLFRLFFTGSQAVQAQAGAVSFTATDFENLVGSAFRDTLTGTIGDNAISGNDGNDFLLGAAGDDDLVGDDGADRLRGGAGADLLDGGAGSDFADFAGSTLGVSVNLTIAGPQDTGQGFDTLISIENVISGDGADLLIGDDLNNFLISNAGNDVLVGGAGDDTFRPGAGSSMIQGGAGSDTVEFLDAGSTDLNVSLFAPGQSSNGFSTLSMSSVENVRAGNGNDRIVGNAGSNRLEGNFGNDELIGGAGNDSLLGGRGLDTLTGGAGSDQFFFGLNEFRDTILDFEDDIDTIIFVNFDGLGPGNVFSFATETGGDVVFDFDTFSDERLTVLGTTIAELQDDLAYIV